ncbi:CbtA family protein [Rhizobium lentis]|uniref:CbtA family protein n=1 Tax=Rhizobium lentis TaxID=1138194 RepID=UPI001C82C354|nr:CbtA family protein [Rhizobium lentis]MBX5135572.1 CbtA family protein [Rhizobium lentis]MBX5141526.1 CbtA family protein [Rhizobium lentis]MBX5153685.1 CbtA family protein [Rhizobium lentis]
MLQRLLLAGMLSGLIVALLSFGFARAFSEPTVERAIVLEERSAADHSHAEEETVSRATQRNLGLLTGIASYSVALGGILAIGLGCLHGRLGLGPRSTVWTLASLGYVSLVLVPQLKYPANPPGIGSAETIGSRTELYFLLILLSLVSMALSFWIGVLIRRRHGGMFSVPAGALAFAAMAMILVSTLPDVQEVPSGFPDDLLFTFRAQSAILQLIVWGGLGAIFGQFAKRILDPRVPRISANAGIPNA